ncbi:MAG: Gfo/Idh/MocA family oxidoreductase [Bacteroidales bacterium]
MKIAVIGAGHWGKIHLKCLQHISNSELIGFNDINPSAVLSVENLLDIPHFDNLIDLMDRADIIDIVTPIDTHFEIISTALRKRKHVLVEKNMATTKEQAHKLVSLANEAQVKTQVGNTQRFNPAFLKALPIIQQPLFIEVNNFSSFDPKNANISVVEELMIHDIDLLLSVVNSDIKKIQANGISSIGESADLVNARIEFNNGCVANLTANRISTRKSHKIRFFEKDSYISVNLLERTSKVSHISKSTEGTIGFNNLSIDSNEYHPSQIHLQNLEIQTSNDIESELRFFLDSIRNNTNTIVSFAEFYQTLEVVSHIRECISRNNF